MAPQYGEVRVDYITYTTGVSPNEANVTVPVSGLVNNPTFSGNVIIEGNTTIDGDLTVSGSINASGVIISGITGLFDDGTEALPSIAFASDPDTGIYKPATNEIGISTNASEALRIDDTGNVGIGTDNPRQKLEISGAFLVSNPLQPKVLFEETTENKTYSFRIDASAGFRLRDETENADRITVSTSGNFGIGTASPTAKLDVNGDATINSITVGRGGGDLLTNTAIGYQALYSNTTGNSNTANGRASLYSNTTGASNTATGRQALNLNTTGDNNTATGRQALNLNTTGGSNTANGYQALLSNTTGSANVANGYQALYSNTTGNNNTANGYQAFFSNLTGTSNAVFGHQAGYYIEGSNNTVLGARQGTAADSTLSDTVIISAGNAEKLRIDSTGSLLFGGTLPNEPNTTITSTGAITTAQDTTINSITVGRGGGDLLTNTAIGNEALLSNTTGTNNTANGRQALYFNTTGSNNVANGHLALFSNTEGNTNTAIGVNALYANTTGNGNTANGFRALYNNTTGSNNVANGYRSLFFNTTANANTANGRDALYSNTTGSNNTVNGYQALYNNTTGTANTAHGYSALRDNTTGSNNTANGFQALLSNTTGGSNVANGRQALYFNTTGTGNVANGRDALYFNTEGAYNIACGFQALYSNTTGSYNIADGKDALYSNTTGSGNIGIGFRNNIGTYAPVFDPTTEDNRLVLGHTAITNAYVKVAWTVTSDERDKMNFAPVPHGLDFVNQLKPTAYQFKVDRDTETPNGDVRYGFKAQDILALEGDNPVIIDTEDADHLKYKGEHLVPILVNAVQELTTMVKELQAEIKTLKG